MKSFDFCIYVSIKYSENWVILLFKGCMTGSSIIQLPLGSKMMGQIYTLNIVLSNRH